MTLLVFGILMYVVLVIATGWGLEEQMKRDSERRMQALEAELTRRRAQLWGGSNVGDEG